MFRIVLIVGGTWLFCECSTQGAEPRVEEKLAQRLEELRKTPPQGQPPAAPRFPFTEEEAKRYQSAYAEWLGLPREWTMQLAPKVELTWVLIPPGTFRIGSPETEVGRNLSGYDETPTTATLTQPYYLSKYETTVGAIRKFVEANQYTTDLEKKGGGNAHDELAVWKHRPGTTWLKPGYAGKFELLDTHPVVQITHNDARAFAAWINQEKRVGLKFDLPTEAQWEWACRAGSGARYWWGNEPDTTGKVANVCDKSLKRMHPQWPREIMNMDDGHAYIAPVGSYRANAFGLHDMLGNVWEFCSTRFGPYPKEQTTDPGDLDPKRGYAVRGGGWSNIASDVRCASRNADPPDFGHSNLGFRLSAVIDVMRGK